MDAEELLHTWLEGSVLRHSTRAEYAREIGSFLTWCTSQTPSVDALTARPKDIAAWSYDRFLSPYLTGRAFDGPDALADLAEQHPEVARSHDRRISALTQYYEAALTYQEITLPPNLTALRSGVTRPAGAKNRLDPMERATLFTVIGGWGADHSKHYERDRLAIWLLLEGLRPAQVVRVDTRHLYPQPDGTWEIRAPDEHENVGKQFVLQQLTGAALKDYLKVRPDPADPAEYALLLNDNRQALQSRWVNKLVGQMAATHPLLADRRDTKTGEPLPPATADTIAHTGFWDTPAGG
jgi:integrase